MSYPSITPNATKPELDLGIALGIPRQKQQPQDNGCFCSCAGLAMLFYGWPQNDGFNADTSPDVQNMPL